MGVEEKHINSASNTALLSPTRRAPTARRNGSSKQASEEWTYARSCRNSGERAEMLDPWLYDYNFHRPHSSLKLKTPAARAALMRNNLLSLHSERVMARRFILGSKLAPSRSDETR
jgi:hypothetical protein